MEYDECELEWAEELDDEQLNDIQRAREERKLLDKRPKSAPSAPSAPPEPTPLPLEYVVAIFCGIGVMISFLICAFAVLFSFVILMCSKPPENVSDTTNLTDILRNVSL